MKVILNKCFGGFHPSHEAYMRYAEKKGIQLFCYELTASHDYKKTQRGGIFSYYFMKDFGDTIKREDVDWNSMLRLSKDFREDSTLIEVVEELGEKASSGVSDLQVVEIPDGMKYVIDDYDGVETLHADVPTW